MFNYNMKSKSTEKYFEKDFCHDSLYDTWQCYGITDVTKKVKTWQTIW